jgi:large subunit ribosomal protein L4
MIEAAHYSASGAKQKGAFELPADLFDGTVHEPVLHQAVKTYLNNQRQGTAKTKTRSYVSGGNQKPWKQKGTGRARQGSTRAPQFAGGGVVHGPTPRSYAQRTPKKMKAAALRGALSDRARNGRVHVVSALVDGDVPSTSSAVAILANLSERRHVLVVVPRADELTWKSLRNAETVHLLAPDQLNTYDVLVSDDVVFTRSALEDFLAGPSRGKSASATALESEVEAPAEKSASKKSAAKKTAAKKAAAKKTAAVTPAEAAVDEAAGSEEGDK